MNRTWLGVAVGLLVFSGWLSSVWSQSGPAYVPSWTPPAVQVTSQGNAMMSSAILPTSSQSFVQQMVIVDSAAKSIAVYHVQQDTGVIVLKSVRRIDADLGMEEFNGAEPAPSKIRGILPQR